MNRIHVVAGIILVALVWAAGSPSAQTESEIAGECLACHKENTPGLYQQWYNSQHAVHKVTCIDCHGSHHKSAEDATRASLMVGRLCERCHPTEMAQFKSGKHAQAWASVYRFTKVFELPPEMIDAEEGCGGCHAIGRG